MAQVSGVAVAAVGAGLVFVWSGLKGASILSAVQDIIQGNKPTGAQKNPIGVSSGTGGGGSTAAPAGPGKTVCASEYGGSSDPTSGSHGYHGDNLNGTMAYAELGMGTALGGLP